MQARIRPLRIGRPSFFAVNARGRFLAASWTHRIAARWTPPSSGASPMSLRSAEDRASRRRGVELGRFSPLADLDKPGVVCMLAQHSPHAVLPEARKASLLLLIRLLRHDPGKQRLHLARRRD